MKAAQITAYGGTDVLKTVDDAQRPAAAKDQLLIEVYAAGVNPFDIKVREGYVQKMAPLTFPATLGGDFAGIVAEIGDQVTGFKIGDAVYGQANALSGQGSYAEFTPVLAASAALKPTSVDFVTAASTPLAGVSAYQALVEHANLQKDQKILIHGGAGGIGSFAIQLAKHLGAYVATTASADSIDFVTKLGADKVIDYKAQAFETQLADYDAIYDTIGGETFTKSLQILKPGGVIVSMVAPPDDALAKKYNIQMVSQFTRVTTERLNKLAKLIDEGAIKANIDKTFPIQEAAQALAYLKEGKHQGKVVIVVKQQ